MRGGAEESMPNTRSGFTNTSVPSFIIINNFQKPKLSKVSCRWRAYATSTWDSELAGGIFQTSIRKLWRNSQMLAFPHFNNSQRPRRWAFLLAVQQSLGRTITQGREASVFLRQLLTSTALDKDVKRRAIGFS